VRDIQGVSCDNDRFCCGAKTIETNHSNYSYTKTGAMELFPEITILSPLPAGMGKILLAIPAGGQSFQA